MTVEITHPDKVLFPNDGYTKADMIGYYRSVADVMLPHMKRHPLAMLRFNQGIHGEKFFHKQAPKYFPEFIDRVEVPKSKGTTNYPICDNLDALLYIANHNTIEFHLLCSTAEDLWHPDRMVFDLDPSTEDFELVREAAGWLHDVLDDMKLPSFLMTSGSRGLHIWVPLDRTTPTDEVVSFAEKVAAMLVDRHPDALTTEFSKADRGDRIYVDVARNAPAQHAVAPYSLRAKDGAPAATPISWAELDDPDLNPQTFTLANMRERLEAVDDPWHGIEDAAVALDRTTMGE